MSEWKPIPGFEKYEASSGGEIRFSATQRIRKPYCEADGTAFVALSMDKYVNRAVHRLVATTFLQKPEGAIFVVHKDFNKLNNAVENLAWADDFEWRQHRANRPVSQRVEHTLFWQCDRVLGIPIRAFEHIESAYEHLGDSCSDERITFGTHAFGFLWKDNQAEVLGGEEWVDLPPGLAGGRDDYRISNYGRVWGPSGKILRPCLARRYTSLCLGTICRNLHIIVARTFLGDKMFDGCVINHKNGNKKDNRVSNLECITQSENALHAHQTGLTRTRKKVALVQVNYAGEIVADFESYAEAKLKTKSSAWQSVNSGAGQVLKGKNANKSGKKVGANGHVWFRSIEEANDFSDANPDYFSEFFHVFQLRPSGEMVDDFTDYEAAVAESGVSKSAICRSCTKGYNAGGYRWFRNTKTMDAFLEGL